MDSGGAAAMRDAEEAAERTFREHRHDAGWLDAFIASLDRRRAVESFRRTTEAWGLSQPEAPAVRRKPSGLSGSGAGAACLRSARVRWLIWRPPTDLLVRYLKRDRIPAVVRRPIPALGGVSLVELLGRGDTGAVLAACRDMFRFDQAQA